MKLSIADKFKIVNGNLCDIEGNWFIIRACSSIEMTDANCFHSVIDNLKSNLSNFCKNGNASNEYEQGLMPQLDYLRTYDIFTSKIEQVEENYYYYQIVIHGDVDKAPNTVYGRSLFKGNGLSDLAGNLSSNNRHGYCFVSIFPYSISSLNLVRAQSPYCLIPPNFLGHEADILKSKMLGDRDTLALKINTDINKQYTSNSIVKVDLTFYPSIKEALEDKNSNTLFINQLTRQSTKFVFGQLKTRDYRIFNINISYRNTIKVQYYNNMTIYYDGDKAYQAVIPYLDKLENLGITILDVLQYSINKDLYYCDLMDYNNHAKKLILNFINRERIVPGKSRMRYQDPGNLGNICVDLKKGIKKCYRDLTIRNSSFVGSLIVPVDNKENIVSQSMDSIIDMLDTTFKASHGYDHLKMEPFLTYKNLLFPTAEKEDDILSQWFAYCTKATKNTDDNIVKAYQNMKENLIQEYNVLSTYMKQYDFSKCLPIPTIQMDKKLKENYYKSLHIEPKTDIIKSIKNQRINPIKETKVMINFMVSERGNIRVQALDLMDYYNTTMNNIMLSYIKLKGDAAHAKTKNRR